MMFMAEMRQIRTYTGTSMEAQDLWCQGARNIPGCEVLEWRKRKGAQQDDKNPNFSLLNFFT